MHYLHITYSSFVTVASPQLSEQDLETMTKYAGDDPVINQLVIYASRARCVRECKAKSLRPNQRYPDPEIVNRFKLREPYSFLHYAYYKVNNQVMKEEKEKDVT